MDHDQRRCLLCDCVAAYLPRDEAERQAVRDELLRTVDVRERTMTVSMFDMIRQEGRQEGLQEGRRLSLLRVLEKKFGPLDETVRQRITTVAAERLGELLDAAATAMSLPEVGLPE